MEKNIAIKRLMIDTTLLLGLFAEIKYLYYLKF